MESINKFCLAYLEKYKMSWVTCAWVIPWDINYQNVQLSNQLPQALTKSSSSTVMLS